MWSKVETSGPRPSARHGHSATALGDGRVLFFGGACEDEDGKMRRFNDVHILDTGEHCPRIGVCLTPVFAVRARVRVCMQAS